MDRASQALALDLPPGVPDTYTSRAEHGKVALSTLHHRARGRRSKVFPFNPDRVLADTPKPPTEFTIPKADKVREGSCPQYKALPTPVAPVSAEALTSLLNMIKQVSDDETSRRLEERL